MLVLTRKIGEKLYIGDNIVVSINGFGKGGKVFVGIEAPKEIPIHRKEVYEALKRGEGKK